MVLRPRKYLEVIYYHKDIFECFREIIYPKSNLN